MRVLLLSICFFVLNLACTHDETSINYGIQEGHASFVPARTAVLPCQTWPNGARYKNLPLTNAAPADISKLCTEFDKFVLAGYDDQPYMRGLTPSVGQRLLTQAGKADFLTQISTLWRHEHDDCRRCVTPPQFYTRSIATRAAWREWLGDLSRILKNADAILLPAVTFAYGSQYNDRGVNIVEKKAGLVLLLIDTNNGNLLWAGGNEKAVASQRLETLNPAKQLVVPSWEELYERLFINDIWKDFPGRQNYF